LAGKGAPRTRDERETGAGNYTLENGKNNVDCQFLFQVGGVYGKDGRKFAAAAGRSGMECMAGRCAAPVK